MQDLEKTIVILLMFSPFILIILGLSVLIKKRTDVLSKHKEYWLIFGILLSTAYLYSFFQGWLSNWQLVWGASGISGAFATYFKKR